MKIYRNLGDTALCPLALINLVTVSVFLLLLLFLPFLVTTIFIKKGFFLLPLLIHAVFLIPGIMS